MDKLDLTISAVAIVAYGVMLRRVIKWLRRKPRDWRYAALTAADWGAWFAGAALAFNWPEGDATYLAVLGLFVCFDVYATARKAAQRRAEGWQLVGTFGGATVHAKMSDDKIDELRKRIQVINGTAQ